MMRVRVLRDSNTEREQFYKFTFYTVYILISSLANTNYRTRQQLIILHTCIQRPCSGFYIVKPVMLLGFNTVIILNNTTVEGVFFLKSKQQLNIELHKDSIYYMAFSLNCIGYVSVHDWVHLSTLVYKKPDSKFFATKRKAGSRKYFWKWLN